MPNDSPPRPIAVLGMHRSGTSSLTGLLEQAGVWVGEVSTFNPHNRKGNRERRPIMVLHNAVLADNDASWDHPPVESCRWSAEHLDQLGALIDQYPADRVWGFKDPRTLFTLDGWLQRVPRLRFVASFRHPMSVALSLHQRNEMPIAQAIELWRRYNQRLVELYHHYRFDLVCFDLAPEAYLQRVADVFRGLRLEDDIRGRGFFDPALRHHNDWCNDRRATELPADAQRLYQRMLRLAGQ